jgi:hypothetical protein
MKHIIVISCMIIAIVLEIIGHKDIPPIGFGAMIFLWFCIVTLLYENQKYENNIH